MNIEHIKAKRIEHAFRSQHNWRNKANGIKHMKDTEHTGTRKTALDYKQMLFTYTNISKHITIVTCMHLIRTNINYETIH